MGTYGRLGGVAAIALLAAQRRGRAFATIAPSREQAAEPPKTAARRGAGDPHRTRCPAPKSYFREERFQRGDTLAGVPRAPGHRRARTPSALAKRCARCSSCGPGTHVSAEVSADGEPIALSLPHRARHAGPDRRPRRRLLPRHRERAQFDTRIVMKSGVIRSSLFAATDDAGIPDSVAMQLADVFGGDIDFHRDLRKGDRFAVVYEMHYFGGRAGARRARARRRVHQPAQDLPRGAVRQRLLHARRQEPAQGVPALAARVLARQLRLRHAPPSDPARPGARTRASTTRRRPARACARSATASSSSPAPRAATATW